MISTHNQDDSEILEYGIHGNREVLLDGKSGLWAHPEIAEVHTRLLDPARVSQYLIPGEIWKNGSPVYMTATSRNETGNHAFASRVSHFRSLMMPSCFTVRTHAEHTADCMHSSRKSTITFYQQPVYWDECFHLLISKLFPDTTNLMTAPSVIRVIHSIRTYGSSLVHNGHSNARNAISCHGQYWRAMSNCKRIQHRGGHAPLTRWASTRRPSFA
jgi:hypothetical protein